MWSRYFYVPLGTDHEKSNGKGGEKKEEKIRAKEKIEKKNSCKGKVQLWLLFNTLTNWRQFLRVCPVIDHITMSK